MFSFTPSVNATSSFSHQGDYHVPTRGFTFFAAHEDGIQSTSHLAKSYSRYDHGVGTPGYLNSIVLSPIHLLDFWISLRSASSIRTAAVYVAQWWTKCGTIFWTRWDLPVCQTLTKLRYRCSSLIPTKISSWILKETKEISYNWLFR